MRCACIDIGSNTTRLLVADGVAGFPQEVEQRRAFTHVRRGVNSDGMIGADKLAEVVAVVREDVAVAARLGAQEVVVVATAAVRRARNAAALAEALERDCGVHLRVLTEDEEARLAFLGACGALRQAGVAAVGELGVVDVGGGSSELIVGRVPGEVRWSVSLALGSGVLADAWFRSDPPAPDELDQARVAIGEALAAFDVPHPAKACAVGGSAASLCRLAGPHLDREAFATAMALLVERPAAVVAADHALDIERVKLLPAGLVILEAVQQRLGVPLEVVGGGLREGVLMELAHV